ncbi:MAG: hypothetical protein M1835_006982 [Candelina submexicana]|nr:MAG: hypothetical protein M1835_006982 [Candelina submexicana]
MPLELRMTSLLVVFFSFLASSALSLNVPEARKRTSVSLINKRTPPNTPVCPPGGRTYGRPELASCRNAFSLVTTHPQETFAIPGSTSGSIGFATVIDRTLYEFGPLGAIRQHPEHGSAPTPRQYNAERCIIAVEMMTGRHHGATDLASCDNLLDTAWSIMQFCVTNQGLGGYELTGQNNDIKVSVFAPNSRYEKGIRPEVRKVYSGQLSGSEIGGDISDREGSPSSSGEATTSSGTERPSGGSPTSGSPKTRPKTRCEATACGEDMDCCDNYACLKASNADTGSMELAWGVKQFFEKTVLSWCMMIGDPSSP